MLDEKPVVQEQEAAEAVGQTPEESTDTGLDNQPSPVGEPETGAQDLETAEPTEDTPAAASEQTEDGGADSEKPETEEAIASRKKRTAKRIEQFRTENTALKAQIRAMLSGQSAPAQAPASPATNQAPLPQAPQQDSPEHWAALFHAEQDPVRRQEYARKYEESRETMLEQKLLRKVEERQQRERMAAMFTDELAELDEISPIFKPGSAEVDMNTPLMRAAQAEATIRGQAITDWATLLYWGRKAALNMARAGTLKQQAVAKKAQAKLTETIAKTGLESPAKGAAPSGKNGATVKYQKLQAAAKAGDLSAQKELTRMQLANLIRG